MENKFWHEKWETNNIAFHNSGPNPLLVQHLERLELSPGSRILVPLCGKSEDIAWLASMGLHVVGIELSRIAIDQLFSELKISPLIEDLGEDVFRFSAGPITIFVADIFKVSQKMIGPIDATYDRAALVALPYELRIKYTSHLSQIGGAKTLLITYEYDQNKIAGPPFSVTSEEIKRHYNHHSNQEVSRIDLPGGGLKGVVAAKEVVWLIKK